jgi:uncharacterized protein
VVVLALLALLVWLPVGTAAAVPGPPDPEYPPPESFVVDAVNRVPKDFEERARAEVEAFARRTGAQVAVAVVPTTGAVDPREYAGRLFTRWGVGRSGEDDGVLTVFVVDESSATVVPGRGVDDRFPTELREELETRLGLLARDGRYGDAVLTAQRDARAALGDEAPRDALDPSGESPAFGGGRADGPGTEGPGLWPRVLAVLAALGAGVAVFLVARGRSPQRQGEAEGAG